MQIESLRPAALLRSRELPSRYPLSSLVALVALMLTGAVLLMSTHAYFHRFEVTLAKYAENERTRRIIGEQIVSDLHQISAQFYQLLAEERLEKRKLTEALIQQKLDDIRSALKVIEHGGVFRKITPLASAPQGRLVEEIIYTKASHEIYLLESLELKPLLLEIEAKVAALENLLISPQGGEGSEPLRQPGGPALTRFIKNAEPLFSRISETGNSIYSISTQRLEKLGKEGKDLSRRYQLIELVILLTILTVTFSFCFVLAKKILGFNRALQQEILEKKRAEESISRAKQEWERTFDAVSDAVALLDRHHRIVRLNKAMAALVGKPVEQCVGLYCYQLMHGEDRPPAYCPHCLLINDQKEHKTEQLLASFNSYFEISVSPLFNQQGDLFGSVHIARDISDQKQAEKALQKANEELEQKVEQRTIVLKRFIDELQYEISNRIKAEEALFQTQHQLLHAEKLSAIGKLSASIAHEFNNPLFAIINILVGVQQYESLSPQNEKMVELAIQECDRMKTLIQNLGDFNRPSSGVLMATDLHQTIDNLLLLCKKEFSDRQITVEKDYAPELPPILVVRDQICQVLLNLLTNARDACKDGGQIRISTKVLEKGIAISVEDSGCGISPEHRGKIFKPFFTTKQELHGTGLGLAVSLGIIEKHGGTLAVDSELERGSVFTITLPLAPQVEVQLDQQIIR